MTVAKFLNHAQPDPASACLIWTGYVTTYDYGRLWFAGAHVYAHRLAFLLFRGPIAPGLTLHHVCLEKLCCNPYHLEPMTREDHQRMHRASTGAGSISSDGGGGHNWEDCDDLESVVL